VKFSIIPYPFLIFFSELGPDFCDGSKIIEVSCGPEFSDPMGMAAEKTPGKR